MSMLLSFVSPWEFLLRYTVIVGVILASIGVAICMMAKRITIAVRNVDVVDKRDKLYGALMVTGLLLILAGMIVVALPVEATLYVGG